MLAEFWYGNPMINGIFKRGTLEMNIKETGIIVNSKFSHNVKNCFM
jgi:hypothetical protein